jgi:transcriptional regulator GlxA family with amidase domain
MPQGTPRLGSRPSRATSDDSYRPGFLELLPQFGIEPVATAPKLRVAITLLPRFTLLAFAGFVDALRIASDIGDRSRGHLCTWTLVGADLHPVRASCGAAVTHWQVFNDPTAFDYVVVVGGLLDDGESPDTALGAWLRRSAAAGVGIIGLCTGVFALAQAGVLDGYRCCVHEYHLPDFEARFPNIDTVADQIFVADHGRITCAGGTAAIDLAGWLLEQSCGRPRARKIVPHLLIDELRPPEHPQLLLLDDYFRVSDERVRAAIVLMERHIADSPPVATIARRLGVPSRQLARGFKRSFNLAPSSFFRLMRLRRARWLVLHSSLTITQIAIDCGFADTAHLTRSFKREYRELPTAAREGQRRNAASPTFKTTEAAFYGPHPTAL